MCLHAFQALFICESNYQLSPSRDGEKQTQAAGGKLDIPDCTDSLNELIYDCNSYQGLTCRSLDTTLSVSRAFCLLVVKKKTKKKQYLKFKPGLFV